MITFNLIKLSTAFVEWRSCRKLCNIIIWWMHITMCSCTSDASSYYVEHYMICCLLLMFGGSDDGCNNNFRRNFHHNQIILYDVHQGWKALKKHKQDEEFFIFWSLCLWTTSRKYIKDYLSRLNHWNTSHRKRWIIILTQNNNFLLLFLFISFSFCSMLTMVLWMQSLWQDLFQMNRTK